MRRHPAYPDTQLGFREITQTEVDVFTWETSAHNLLYQHRRWLFVLQNNQTKNEDTTREYSPNAWLCTCLLSVIQNNIQHSVSSNIKWFKVKAEGDNSVILKTSSLEQPFTFLINKDID